jgi:hypothetical protein
MERPLDPAPRNTFLNQNRTESRRLRPGPLSDELDLEADPHALQPEAARPLRAARSRTSESLTKPRSAKRKHAQRR